MIELPEQIEKKLRDSRDLHGAVLHTLRDFDVWLKDNKLPFFPGYTDHGPDHVTAVIRGAEGLVRDDAWACVTSEDAAVLVLAIVLHDCAMHLSEDGFATLVDPKSGWQPRAPHFLDPFRDRPWPELWSEFLREASRFDERRLISLFGASKPARVPPADRGDWTEYDRLLVGEFVRRHHARLAHEIAVDGVPGPAERGLAFARMPDWMRDLAGFVARSHGLDIRACLDRLPRGGRVAWRSVHAPFLMALLRVADYLEIQAPRAPAEVLQVRSLRSPFSRQEWKKHHAVIDVRPHEGDPEALWVDAEPKDVKTFLDLTQLFRGIQEELDASWAVLGEVFGADKKLRDLGLRIRRIRSTLDDVKDFGETVDFIPAHARFQASGAELLKLLIGPLYGHHPAYGIRELMQNAVDACRELEDCMTQDPSLKPELPDLRADVVIFLEELEDGTGWLTVEDRGIGMTPEIVMKYFLTAGASFRGSDAWRQRHENEEGRSRVARSGRFGIGVLAAYLIGDEIEVTTRHFQAACDKGVRFKCHLDDPEVELRWCERPVGTSVKVRIHDPQIIHQIVDGSNVLGDSWDWYTLTKPTVARVCCLGRPRFIEYLKLDLPPREEIVLPQSRTLPCAHSALPAAWARLEQTIYDDVIWARGHTEDIVHNGIAVGSAGPDKWLESEASSGIWAADAAHAGLMVELTRPHLSVFDHQAALPLNVRRTGLAMAPAALDASLVGPICRDLLAFVLVRLSSRPDEALVQLVHSVNGFPTPWNRPASLRYGAVYTSIGRGRGCHWLVFSPGGVTLNEPSLLAQARFSSVLFWPNTTPRRDSDLRSLRASGLQFATLLQSDVRRDAVFAGAKGAVSEIELWHRWATLGTPPEDVSSFWARRHFGATSLLSARSRAVLMTPAFAEKTRSASKYNAILKASQSCRINESWVLNWTGDDPRKEPAFGVFSTMEPIEPDAFFAFWLLSDMPPTGIPPGPIAEAWLKYIGQPIIPFDLTERRNQLAHAYRELAPEIAAWEELTANG